jgi:hypothetical protein
MQSPQEGQGFLPGREARATPPYRGCLASRLLVRRDTLGSALRQDAAQPQSSRRSTSWKSRTRRAPRRLIAGTFRSVQLGRAFLQSPKPGFVRTLAMHGAESVSRRPGTASGSRSSPQRRATFAPGRTGRASRSSPLRRATFAPGRTGRASRSSPQRRATFAPGRTGRASRSSPQRRAIFAPGRTGRASLTAAAASAGASSSDIRGIRHAGWPSGIPSRRNCRQVRPHGNAAAARLLQGGPHPRRRGCASVQGDLFQVR